MSSIPAPVLSCADGGLGRGWSASQMYCQTCKGPTISELIPSLNRPSLIRDTSRRETENYTIFRYKCPFLPNPDWFPNKNIMHFNLQTWTLENFLHRTVTDIENGPRRGSSLWTQFQSTLIQKSEVKQIECSSFSSPFTTADRCSTASEFPSIITSQVYWLRL